MYVLGLACLGRVEFQCGVGHHSPVVQCVHPSPPLRDASVMMTMVIMMLVAVEVAVVVVRPEEVPCGVSIQERA